MRHFAVAAGWAFLLFVTLFVAIVHAGCSKKQTPVAKPEPMTVGDTYSCLMVERNGKSDAIFCGSAELCQHAHDRLVSFWEVLETRYGVSGLSDCVVVGAEFTAKE